jgi:hypothetical protein
LLFSFFPLNFEPRTVRPPAEAFGHVPHIASPALSPDGRLLAWGDNSEASQVVVMFDLTAGTERRRLAVSADMRLRDLLWADNETLLMTMSLTHAVGRQGRYTYEWSRILAVDVGGGPMRVLLMRDSSRSMVTGAALIASRTGEPKTVMMSSWDFALTRYRQGTGTRIVDSDRRDAGWVHSLFAVDTRSGKGKLVEQGTPYTADWIADDQGQPIARSEWDPERRVFRVLHKDGRSWKEIHRKEGGGTLALYGLSQDGKAVMAVGAGGQPRSRLWAIPLDGSGAHVLIEDAEDVEFVVQDRYSLAPVGVRIGGAEPRVLWLDTAAEARAAALARAIAGLRVDILGASEDGSRLVARTYSHSQPATYYVADFLQGRCRPPRRRLPGADGRAAG